MHSHILIVGGGLSGLIAAIHMAQEAISVTLIEKDTYPKHKVCGEYISNEVLPYFDFLGIDISQIKPVEISNLTISTQRGNSINSKLPLGGFGISRYALDHFLWKKAEETGVKLITDQVIDIKYHENGFKVITSQNLKLTSDYIIGAYGKRSVLDKVLQRQFSNNRSPWLAVKAHYRADYDSKAVALHNFKGGYCGISKVENNDVNVCYLVSYKSFKKHKSIDAFQKEVMCQNKHLKSFFDEAKPLFDAPITISQVNFDKKKPVENHIFMTGDAAGLIHPLCGNGMAMAIQSAKIVSELLIKNYNSTSSLSRIAIEKRYIEQWDAAFSKRLYTGRVLQKVLLNRNLQRISYQMASMLPSLVPKIIKQTHGDPLVC